MMSVKRTKCCCDCMTLRSGTIIITVLYIISSTYQFVISIYNLVQLTSYDGQGVALGEFQGYQLQQQWVGNNGSIINYIVVVMCLIELLLSFLLLHGVSKDEESKCWPWLYYNIFLFGVQVLLAIVTIFTFLIVRLLLGVALLLIYVIVFTIVGYWLVVVRDYILGLSQVQAHAHARDNNAQSQLPPGNGNGNEGKVYYDDGTQTV